MIKHAKIRILLSILSIVKRRTEIMAGRISRPKKGRAFKKKKEVQERKK